MASRFAAFLSELNPAAGPAFCGAGGAGRRRVFRVKDATNRAGNAGLIEVESIKQA